MCMNSYFQLVSGSTHPKKDGGVAVGHLLVFKYEGNSHFNVLIFDATATEIDYTLDDELQVHRIEDDESDDSSVEIIKHFYRGEGSGLNVTLL